MQYLLAVLLMSISIVTSLRATTDDQAASRSSDVPAGSGSEAPVRGDDEDSLPLAVSIQHARLERAEPMTDAPSAMLKFDVFNDGDDDVEGIELSVSVLGPVTAAAPPLRPVLVRPFRIHVNAVLMSGYSLEYVILMRNLDAGCDCVPKVQVLAGRPLPDPQP
jgi:hypothetical protein